MRRLPGILAAALLGWTVFRGSAWGEDPVSAPIVEAPPAEALPTPERVIPDGVVHDGIPIADLQALHPEEGRPPQTPDFGTAATGWALIVPQGVVFVFVGRDAEEAVAWTALQLQRQRHPAEAVAAPPAGIEAAWRRDLEFALLRDDNVGIMVQGTAEATEEALRVRGLIQDQGRPWPAPPRLESRPDGAVELRAPGALHLSYQGGRRRAGQGLVFDQPPLRAVAWDELGRAAVWTSAEGPAPAPPP